MSNEHEKNMDISGLQTSKGKQITSGVRLIRSVFAVLAVLFAACVIVQVSIAGLAIFTDSAYWSGHIIFVRIFSFLPLVMLTFSLIGRLPKDLISICAVMFVVIVAQYITASLSGTFGIIAAFHVIFALMLFGGSTTLIRRAWGFGFGKDPANQQ